MRSFSRTWTNELAGSSIRVNTLSPGPIDTPMLQEASPDVLVSDESSFIAGAEICIDGGMAQV